MSDRPPTPAERLEQLTSLYERQAYTVWNVAWRTTLSEEKASAAARRAFLAQVTAPDERRVPLDSARHAAEAATRPDPREVDDQVLSATARLAPVQRAVLALSALTRVEGAEVAAVLGIEPAMEADLRRRGYEELAALLDMSADEAEEACADVEWAPPPEDLWAALYPEIHSAVTRNARAAEAAPDQPEPQRRKRRFPIPRVAIAAVGLLAAAGVAWAASGGDESGAPPATSSGGYAGLSTGAGRSPQPDAPADAPSPARAPLSPKELDQLRKQEIENLKRYMRQKDDKRLPPRQRRHAAQKVSDLVKLAQARQRAAEGRELAIRRALAREREARMRERAQREEAEEREQRASANEQPSPRPDDRGATQEPARRDEPERPDDARTRDEAEAECLYNADTGSYICPE